MLEYGDMSHVNVICFKYWSICQNLKHKEKKPKIQTHFYRSRSTQKRKTSSNTIFEQIFQTQLKPFGWEKKAHISFLDHTIILIHLQKAYRCGLDRSCSSCKYALLWQVSVFSQRVGHCTEGQKNKNPTKQPWEYMKNTFHSELELNIFYTETRPKLLLQEIIKGNITEVAERTRGVGIHLGQQFWATANSRNIEDVAINKVKPT